MCEDKLIVSWFNVTNKQIDLVQIFIAMRIYEIDK